jgi:hypothetical protein
VDEQVLLADDVGVRLDGPADDRLPLAEDGFDDDAVAVAGPRVRGSAVKITPDRSDWIMRWTTTAIAGSPVNPRLAR